MKNKRKKMIMVMFISILLLLSAGFSNAISMSGYYAFKDGVRTTLNLSNAAADLSIYVATDGVVDECSTINTHIEAGPEDTLSGLTPELIRVIEILADALSGSAKDYFYVKEENGYRTVTAKLNKEQIPEILPAALNFLIRSEKHDNYEYSYIPGSCEDPNDVLADKIYAGLIDKVEVASFDIYAVMDENNCFTEAKAEGVFLFTDCDGFAHEFLVIAEFKSLLTTALNDTFIYVPVLKCD